MKVLRASYAIVGYGLVALGFVHVLATARFFSERSQAALWFASGGIMMMAIGALILLRRAYGHAATGLRRVCHIANLVLVAFALLAGSVSRATAAEFALVIVLTGGVLLLGFVSGASLPARGTAASGRE
jgi:hypothetical protein